MAIEDLIEEAAADGLKNLKKLIGSKGRLQGNFYYAGLPKGTQAGIVITLTAKDPKGARATGQGKPIRAGISGAKFARGTVSTQDGKLLFTLLAGNATSDHMKLGFKKGFEARPLKALKTLLKKSVFETPGEAAAAVVDESETIEEVELTSEEMAELAELLQDQGDLAERNAELQGSFLSVEETQADLEEMLTGLTDRISALESADTPDADAIQEARYALAEALYVGADPFPEVGDDLPDEVRHILEASVSNLSASLSAFNAQVWGQVVAGYRSAASTAGQQVDALRRVLRASEDVDLHPIADTGLNAITDNHRVPLEAAILDFDSATTAQRAAAMATVSVKAQEFLDHIQSSEKVAHVDTNPFGVECTVAGLMTIPLTRIVDFAKNAQL